MDDVVRVGNSAYRLQKAHKSATSGRAGMTLARHPALTNNRIRGAIMAVAIPTQISDDVKARFWDKAHKDGPDDCWPWKNAKGGYGHFYIEGSRARAHRVAYAIENGPIPAGLLVCHKCDNPPCVNPAHLWLGTYRDNNRDKAAKGRNVRPKRDEGSVRHRRGEASNFAKLSDDDVRDIRARREAGEMQAKIAAEYNIHRTAVWAISKRKAWAHVD